MIAEQYNGLTLAYIGDAYYELLVRNLVIKSGNGKVNDLHKMAVSYTSGEAQARFITAMIDENFLSEKEIEFYKKGRNCHTNQNRKNISVLIHQKATGFESLIGYLYLEEQYKRINEIMEYIEKIVKVGKDNGQKA